MRRSLVWACLLVLLLASVAAADDNEDRAREWVRILGTDEESGRFEALNALIALRGHAVKPCLELLEDTGDSGFRRWQAAKALGALKAREAAPALLKVVLNDREPVVVLISVEALGLIGDDSVLPDLKQRLKKENDADLRHALETAIARLEGRDPPEESVDANWVQPEIRTGTAFSDSIEWAPTVEEALARAKREKKLVLATVVTVADQRWSSGYEGSEDDWQGMKPPPMGDEAAMASESGLVKEQVMMASLFSDPEIVHLVRAHFVPVRVRLHTYCFEGIAHGTRDRLTGLGVKTQELGAPALVFSRSNGRLVHACRRMGVFSVPMIRSTLHAVLEKARVRNVEPFQQEAHAGLEKAWQIARRGELAECRKVLEGIRWSRGSSRRSEGDYLRGYVEDKLGDREAAERFWAEARDGDPTGPWGSKAEFLLRAGAAPLDEWESMLEFEFDPLAPTTETQVERDQLDEVIERAVDFLLFQQRPDGGWRDARRLVQGGGGPLAAFDMSVARTGLVVDALIQARRHLPQRTKELDRAIRRGIDYVGLFADRPPPHVWQLTYALHLQTEILKSKLESGKRDARRRAGLLIKALEGIQQDGGWSYMSAPRVHSFNTAPVLLMLAELKDHGVKIPKGMADAAATFLEGLRGTDDPRNFQYAPTMPFPPRASSCRTALCELALLAHAGGKKTKRLKAGVEFFFEHEAAVRGVTKIYESYFSPDSLQDAYHYYFGHYYAARALARLPQQTARRYAARQIDILLGQVELDGSFVDAQMQGKSYSTAMALLTLLEDLRHVKP